MSFFSEANFVHLSVLVGQENTIEIEEKKVGFCLPLEQSGLWGATIYNGHHCHHYDSACHCHYHSFLSRSFFSL